MNHGYRNTSTASAVSTTTATTTTTTSSATSSSIESDTWTHPPKWTCQWSPDNTQECDALLSIRLPPRAIPTNALKPRDENSGPRKERWLFFGDSTINLASKLNRILVEEPFIFSSRTTENQDLDQHRGLDDNNNHNSCWASLICENRHTTGRCDNAAVFQLEQVSQWDPPQHFSNFEGPVINGAFHPYCNHCGSCDPQFLHCVPNVFNPDIDLEHLEKTCVITVTSWCMEGI